MNISDLIQPHHLNRRAAVYVRQSTPQQVTSHQESLRLQYALTQRAHELGWHENDIQVIDTDLGQTAASIERRAGFQQLVAGVTLGEIGMLFAYDATRLARNCSHWYQLLDVCGHADCLIADRDGVYDPSSINGRLLLGLKGQISELELHTICARLTAGILSKAQRGELAIKLPVGLVRLPSGEVVKHPDRQVQDRLHFIFQAVLEKKSIMGAVRYLRECGVTVPRQDRFGDIVWKRPTVARVVSMAKNPAYAGAYVYGRSRWQKNKKTGKYYSKRLPPTEWKVCLRDKYPSFISWETFEKIQAMLHDNYSEYQRRNSRGVPRGGQALLQGLVYCGECGRKMFARYKGTVARYVCDSLRNQQREPTCQYLPVEAVDTQVVRWFFEALSIAEIDAAAGTLQEADRRRNQLLSTRRQEVERLQYQASFAARQYNHTDPENRLVAAELERRWEEALQELKEAEERLQKDEQETTCWAIPADLLEDLKSFGPRLPELWKQGLFSVTQQKSLLRCLVDKVVLHRMASDTVRVRVVWRGGATTSDDVRVPVGSLTRLSNFEEMEEVILRMANEGHRDEEIANWLTEHGYRSPLREFVLRSTVQKVRLRRGLKHRKGKPHPRQVSGYLTVSQIAEELEIPREWICSQIRKGTVRPAKNVRNRCHLFPDKPETLRKFGQLYRGEIKRLDD